MSHMPVGLDLEDLTPKQLRKALSHYARASMPHSKRKKEGEEDEDEDKEAEDNDDLVDLHREKGDSKPPKVAKDDLPKGLFGDDEEESDSKKKGKS